MRLIRKWSPLGYDRAVALFQRHFYDHSHFFRTVHGFLVQFGISYTTDEDLQHFASIPIQDDPHLDPPIPFEEGTVSYAGSGPNSRDSQLFIAYDAIDSFVRFLCFLM
jgi:cyclophilin family peptidyl-prolyl cis-trans isomerase